MNLPAHAHTVICCLNQAPPRCCLDRAGMPTSWRRPGPGTRPPCFPLQSLAIRAAPGSGCMSRCSQRAAAGTPPAAPGDAPVEKKRQGGIPCCSGKEAPLRASDQCPAVALTLQRQTLLPTQAPTQGLHVNSRLQLFHCPYTSQTLEIITMWLARAARTDSPLAVAIG